MAILMWIYASLATMIIGFLAGWQINGFRLNAEIAQLHATWNEAYANQTNITIAKEHELDKLNTQIEVTNAVKEKAISAARDKNIKLAADIERLQHTTSARGSSLPKTSTSCKCTGAASQSGLSGESINLLVDLAREADEAARYANICHEWAVGVTKELD